MMIWVQTGIAFFLAFGIALYFLVLAYGNRRASRNMDKSDFRENIEQQGGFIEIDEDQITYADHEEGTDSVYRLKRKLARFKLRNRFYK